MNKGLMGAYGGVLIAISFLVALLVPLPSFILDMVLVIIIGFSILLYMRATTINEWDELSTFPSILLMLGIFRVAVNISTTRKILSDGEAGHVIEQFGSFVIGGNLLIGIVIFIILIIFQFVITNGAARTAEVAARFTLDGMQNKYMSIDLDSQKGFISEKEAQGKRKKITLEADFYGSMDGAGKFLKGDAIFGIAIVFVNIIFGMIVGVGTQDMSFGEAAVRYTTLTVGDGIVTQIGSLMTAIASGVVITRVFDDSSYSLPKGIYRQMMHNEVVVFSLGGLFIALGLFTQLPLLPFGIIGVGVIVLGIKHQRELSSEKKEKENSEKNELLKKEEAQSEEISENFGVHMNSHPILVEMGIDLVPLISQKIDGATASDKVNMMRKTIAKELGIRVPGIQFQDNTKLKPKGKYVIKIKGTRVAEGVIKSGHLFALKTPHVMQELNAEPGKDPIFGEEGYWIEEDMLSEARMENYQILEPLAILVTHLDMAIRSNLHELIQRQQIKDLLDGLEEENPILLEEIKKKNVDLSLIQRVIKELLKEKITIQELPSIVEGVIDGSVLFSNIDDVTSLVRERVALSIVETAKSDDGKIHGIFLPEQVEAEVNIEIGHNGYTVNWSAEFEGQLLGELAKTIRRSKISGINPVLLMRRKDFRFAITKVLQRQGIDISVLAIEEITNVPGTYVEQIQFLD